MQTAAKGASSCGSCCLAQVKLRCPQPRALGPSGPMGAQLLLRQPCLSLLRPGAWAVLSFETELLLCLISEMLDLDVSIKCSVARVKHDLMNH